MIADERLARPRCWKRRQPSLAWLAPVVFIQFFCATGTYAFVQGAVSKRHGSLTVALWSWTLGLRGFISFFITPGIGALSDHYGRKPLLGLQMLASVAFAIPLAFSPESEWAVDSSLVLMGIMGISGGQFVLSFAYCADLAPPGQANEVQAITARMLAGSFAPAFMIAPPAWKYLFQLLGERSAWTLVASLGIANAAYAWILVPESRKLVVVDAEEQKTPCRGAGPPDLSRNPLRYFRLLALAGPAGPESAHYLWIVSGVIFFLYVAKMTVIATITEFAQQRFGWSPGNAGLLMSTWGLSQFLSMLVVGAIGQKVDERIVSWVGLISALVGMLIFFFAIHGWMLFVGMAIGAISMISLTSLTSYAGCLVRTSMRGEVQGLSTAMVCLTEMFGPPLFGTLMSSGLSDKQAPWYVVNLSFGVGALCVIIAMVLACRLPHLTEAMRKCGRTLDESILQFFPDES